MRTRDRARRWRVATLVVVLALAAACAGQRDPEVAPSVDTEERAIEAVTEARTEPEDEPSEASEPTEEETEPPPATDDAEPTDAAAPDEVLEDGRHPTFLAELGEPSGAEGVPWTLDELPAHLAGERDVPEGRLGWNPFWLTVEDGVVVAIDEQYLP
jgi:hypothetical protein